MIAIGVTFLIFVTGVLVARYKETKDWNGGISKYTGGPWQHFYSTFIGTRGYYDSYGNIIWLFFTRADKKGAK